MVANSDSAKATYAAPAAPATTPAKTPKPLEAKPSGHNRLFTHPDQSFGDWRDDLLRDGYAVVKGAVPRERADQYADQMHSWLENFRGGMGYKRDDPSTIKHENLPIINEKGMVNGYGISHEDFTWAVRQEPGVVDAFQKVYDTEDLIVSFDIVNMAFPNRTDMASNNPWPHQDQNRTKHGFRCMQGIVNILPNGPKDGGLIACKGAHLLSTQFHEDFEDEPNRIWAWTPEWYGITAEGMDWLKNKGCEWVKICAEPGDLILWDSRTPHYNLTPEGTNPRFCFYTCYMPAAEATQEDLIRKKGAFETLQSTTHWPNALHVGGGLPVLRNGEPDPYNINQPRQRPELNETGFKLTGIPYIKA
ncbi:phytanoyl-CoA hydroxylase [Microdochium nivale]|nr:phytanoyl-CoA hydroxylase [Microdochium nivale]